MRITKSMIQSYHLYTTLNPVNVSLLSILYESSRDSKFTYSNLISASKQLNLSVNAIKTRIRTMENFGLLNKSEGSYAKSIFNLTKLGNDVIEKSSIRETKKLLLSNFSQYIFLKTCSDLSNFRIKDTLMASGFSKKQCTMIVKSFQKKNGIILIDSRMKINTYTLTPFGQKSLELMLSFEQIFNKNRISNFPDLTVPHLQLEKFDFLLAYYILHEVEESKVAHYVSTLSRLSERLLIRKSKLKDLLSICESAGFVTLRAAERREQLIYLTHSGMDFYNAFEKLLEVKVM